MPSASEHARNELIVIAFRKQVGEKQFQKFANEINKFSRHLSRLRYWQEKLWETFTATYDGEVPQSPVEIAAIFGFSIPERVLQFAEMKADREYLLDLVQLPDGIRYIQPRRPADPVTPHTVFSMHLATGPENQRFPWDDGPMKLTNGIEVVVDPHMVWMTVEESEYFHFKRRSPDETKPWINGMPPQLPPK